MVMSQPYRAPAGALLLAFAGTLAVPASAEPPRLWQAGDAVHYPGLARRALPAPAVTTDALALPGSASAWIEQKVIAADGAASGDARNRISAWAASGCRADAVSAPAKKVVGCTSVGIVPTNVMPGTWISSLTC